MQYNATEKYILSLIDARNNRVYYGLNKLTKLDNGKVKIEKILDVNNDLIEDALKNITQKDILIAGNCIDNFKDTLSSISNDLVELYPTTEDLIDCYLNISDRDDYMYNAYTLDALYARPSQAERMSNNG